jgi:protein-tyrosine phosphatase
MPPEGAPGEPGTEEPAGLIDLHCHLLPGVDDGAADLDEALAMCRLATADGCSTIVATPHLRHELWCNGDRAHLQELCDEIRAHLPDQPIVLLGGEIAVNSQSVEEMFQLPDGDLLTLADSRYLLLELDFFGLGPDPLDLVYELGVRGWWPVIAHPERVPWLAYDLALARALVDHGALLQLTAKCVTGELGRAVREACDGMLDAGLVAFVASDAHSVEMRTPGLRTAWRRVAERWGPERATELFIANPRAVIENRPLPAAEARAADAASSDGGGS